MEKWPPASRLMVGLSANEDQPAVVTMVDGVASTWSFGG
jgi:hypothetical protein